MNFKQLNLLHELMESYEVAGLHPTVGVDNRAGILTAILTTDNGGFKFAWSDQDNVWISLSKTA